MASPIRRRFGIFAIVCVLVVGLVGPARANEIWVAPTSQQDLGGLGIGSNVFWPVTPIGAVRLAWGVPDDLQTFQGAKVVLIPHTATEAGTLSLFVCRAQNSDLVGAACTGPIPHAFRSVANRLLEVDVSAAIAAQVGVAGLNYLAVLAYTTPTTTTDHIVGLRFAYAPKTPTGVATFGANTFTGTQTAPAFVGDGSSLTNLPPGPQGPTGPAGPQGETGATGATGAGPLVYRAGFDQVSHLSDSKVVTFGGAFASTPIVTVTVANTTSNVFASCNFDIGYFNVANASPTGFTFEIRDIDGSTCRPQDTLTFNWFAVAPNP